MRYARFDKKVVEGYFNWPDEGPHELGRRLSLHHTVVREVLVRRGLPFVEFLRNEQAIRRKDFLYGEEHKTGPASGH